MNLLKVILLSGIVFGIMRGANHDMQVRAVVQKCSECYERECLLRNCTYSTGGFLVGAGIMGALWYTVVSNSKA